MPVGVKLRPGRSTEVGELFRLHDGERTGGSSLRTITFSAMERLVASWFGSGLLLRRVRGSDDGSGTVGAALALIVALALAPVGWWAQALAAIVVTGASLWSTRPFAETEGDPGWVVVDEAAGTLLATIGLSLGPALVAFVVFRVADITKKFPGVAAAERLPGAVGITADDLVAGGFALVAGWIVQSLL
jgi:phosphatidylglycerophosphatase A